MAQPIEQDELASGARQPVDIVNYLSAPRSAAPRRNPLWRLSRDMYVWAAVSLVLGILITAQLRSKPAQPPVDSDYPRQVAAATIERLESEQTTLKQEIADLRQQISVQQKEAAKNKSTFTEISNSLKQEQTTAGLTALVGQGVKVVLDDSTVKTIPVGEDPANYLVHEYDLRDVVNVLWANGAEAIGLNGERIVGTTSIYCVGSTILVNDTRMSPPYTFYAIGDPAKLAAAVQDEVALPEILRRVRVYEVQFSVEQSAEVKVPAFNGTMRLKYAQPGVAK